MSYNTHLYVHKYLYMHIYIYMQTECSFYFKYGQTLLLLPNNLVAGAPA